MYYRKRETLKSNTDLTPWQYERLKFKIDGVIMQDYDDQEDYLLCTNLHFQTNKSLIFGDHVFDEDVFRPLLDDRRGVTLTQNNTNHFLNFEGPASILSDLAVLNEPLGNCHYNFIASIDNGFPLIMPVLVNDDTKLYEPENLNTGASINLKGEIFHQIFDQETGTGKIYIGFEVFVVVGFLSGF